MAEGTSTDWILPDGELAEEERAFARRVREFSAEKLAPHARRIDEECRFRHESVAELAEARLLGGPIDRVHGGEGWSATELAVAHEEFGAVCGNTRGFLAVQAGLVAASIERYGDERHKGAWLNRLARGDAIGCFCLTEPDAGSDVASLKAHAKSIGDGRYAIHGEKIWITNGGISDVAIVFATVDPAQGKSGITAFVVETDRPGITRGPMPGRDLGHRGSDHAHIRFDGLEVTDDDVLGGIGAGFEVAMGGLHAGRLSVAAGAVGVLRAALSCSLDFTRQREQFGRPLTKFQMVQERLADMATDLHAARALVLRCARRRDAGTESTGDLAVAKLFATEAAARACDQAVMLHGGRGYSSEYPPERLLRDIMGLRIYEGTSMVQKAIIARCII